MPVELPGNVVAPTGQDAVVHSLTVKSSGPYSAVADAGTVAFSPTLGSVVRDLSGRISSYTENGAAVTVTRDQAGRVLTFTMLGTTRTVARDASGRVTGVS